MKKIVLLGASGSIGCQTIDIIRQHPDFFELKAFGVGRNIQKAEEYLHLFPNINTICVQRKEDAFELEKKYPFLNVLIGDEGMKTLASLEDYDLLVNALVGFVGFFPTLAAIETKHDVALANKETLVCGGSLIRKALEENGCQLFPIDSEHSAIWQALQGNKKEQVKNLWITCSGGSFRNRTRDELKSVTVEQALAHPNWSMGEKITIDSATLMNKGFEVIEAHWLFDIDYDHIKVVMHPESVVHSAVEYIDHSIMAQMGAPDMRLPIQYSLTYPERFSFEQKNPLDLCQLGSLHFEKPDIERFPLLALAFEAGKKGGDLCAVMNAANEVANLAFRNGKIPFLMIEETVTEAVHTVPFKQLNSTDDLVYADQWGREFAEKYINR